MIPRTRHLAALRGLLARHPVVAILGPRQIGKTTLARQLARRWNGPVRCFDLESPRDLARLGDPMLALGGLRGLVVLDEIQRVPELFTVLRVLADRRPRPARFLVLGSASPGLLRQSSESLAGRIAHHDLGGLRVEEAGVRRLDQLWQRGGFPRAFVARTEAQSFEWRQEFIRTFLERDLPQLGIRLPAATLRRFWTMVAHYHGQIWNASDFARSFGVADTTVRRYLDLLDSAMVIRTLAPWHENLAKRQVKSPKIYIADSGILHALLGLAALEDVESHPKAGASWEGFALAAVLDRLGTRYGEAYFWATHGGAELDLLVVRGTKRYGFEFKRTVAPRVTTSMRVALKDLRLQRLDVVHAGNETFWLGENIRAIPIARLHLDLKG